MAQAATRNGNGQQRRIGNFNAATRQTLVTLPDMVWPGQASQRTRIELPQTGFFAGLWLLLDGSVTAAAASSAASDSYPLTPYSLIRQIRIFNNQNVELWNTSGYGAYLYQRTERTGFDPAFQFSNIIPTATVFGNVSNPFARYSDRLPDAGVAAGATETFRAALWVPVVWGAPLQHGLQMAQDNAIRYTCEITWGDLTDLTNTVSGTVTLSATTRIRTVAELYQVPESAVDFPNLAFTKIVSENIRSLTAGTGDNTYNFVTGNVLTRLIHELSNVSSSVRNPIDPSAITQLQLQYAQVQKPYVIPADIQLFRQRHLYGADLPPAVLVHELQTGMGLPELPTTRDVLNTSRLTDLQSIITLSGVTLDTAQLRTIEVQLAANR